MVQAADLQEVTQILLRLGAATCMCSILGIDRDIHHKPAGLRVLALVGLGSSAVTMASVLVLGDAHPTTRDGMLRTVQGILAGIGFLGAGVILRGRREDEVHGLTTAASVWVAAVLGIISGMGEWLLGCSTFLITMLILIIGRQIEYGIIRWTERHRPRKEPEPADPPDGA